MTAFDVAGRLVTDSATGTTASAAAGDGVTAGDAKTASPDIAERGAALAGGTGAGGTAAGATTDFDGSGSALACDAGLTGGGLTGGAELTCGAGLTCSAGAGGAATGRTGDLARGGSTALPAGAVTGGALTGGAAAGRVTGAGGIGIGKTPSSSPFARRGGLVDHGVLPGPKISSARCRRQSSSLLIATSFWYGNNVAMHGTVARLGALRTPRRGGDQNAAVLHTPIRDRPER